MYDAKDDGTSCNVVSGSKGWASAWRCCNGATIPSALSVVCNFIVEQPKEESPDELMAKPEELPESWTLFTDGSSCVDDSGAGLILTNLEGAEFTYAMRFRFEATNNEAEYEALIA
ncbi:reverse transcriptase domain-containing protein, partial [Tanacetum coccineum]